MAPIRGGSRKKQKTDEKDEPNSVYSGSSEESSADWFVVLSKKIAAQFPSKALDNFESFFKMSRRTFEYICSLVEEQMTGNFTYSSGKVMTVNDQVAVALRRLSSGHSLISIGESFGAHHSTVSQVTWRFVEAIEKTGLRHLRWPSTDQETRQIKSKFQKIYGLPNCCGVIDTTHITMTLPSSEQRGDVWRDRGNNHSMVLQAIVDPDLRFRDIFAGLPGKMNETSVLQYSNFFALCEKGDRLNGSKLKLPGSKTELREYVIGDSAYPLLPWLITPYQENELLEHKKAEFNKRILTSHVVARRALRRLKESWKLIQGPMWRPDKSRLPRSILVCCILHNIVIDMEDKVVSDEMDLSDDHDPGYCLDVCDFVDPTASVMRNKLSKYICSRPLDFNS